MHATYGHASCCHGKMLLMLWQCIRSMQLACGLFLVFHCSILIVSIVTCFGVTLQGHWLIHGGSCAFDAHCEKEYNQLHVFDFAQLSWIKPPLDSTLFKCRRGHMSTCHNESMIVLGGMQRRLLLFSLSTCGNHVPVYLHLYDCA